MHRPTLRLLGLIGTVISYFIYYSYDKLFGFSQDCDNLLFTFAL